MLINELHDKLRRIVDADNKRADTERVPVTAMAAGTAIAAALFALLSYFSFH